MAQLLKHTPDTSTPVTDLDEVNVSATTPNQRNNIPRNEYVPFRTLKNSVASTAPFDDSIADFEALVSDIPDNFGTNHQPKMKFLFTVQFFPRNNLYLPEEGDQDMEYMNFALKRASRPQPTITYQDVNFYGFRTKVATKLDYGTVTLAFYDDVVNKAHNIVSQYINYVSPISLFSKEQADNLDGSYNNARSIGALLDSPLGPFQAMRVTHHVLDDKSKTPNVSKQVFYDYLNPKILNVNLDDLDMTQSDVSTVEVVFVYDSVNITYSDQESPNPTTIDSKNNPIVVEPAPAPEFVTNATKNALKLNDVIPSWVTRSMINSLNTNVNIINDITRK